MSEIEHLSYSSVSAYLMCARSWKFRYIDQIKTPVAAALPFGSAFHEAIRLYSDAVARGQEPEQIIDLFNSAWQWRIENEDIDYGDETEASLRETGHRMLSSKDVMSAVSSIEPMVVDGQPVSEKRVEFSVNGVPVPIVGYIDMIDAAGVPCDFKTAARSWYDSKAQEELQPSFYLEALRQAGEFPASGSFRYYVFTKARAPKAQIIETSRTDAQLDWTRDLIRDVWAGIESEVFPPNGVGGWKCSEKYCEYWNICRGK